MKKDIFILVMITLMVFSFLSVPCAMCDDIAISPEDLSVSVPYQYPSGVPVYERRSITIKNNSSSSMEITTISLGTQTMFGFDVDDLIVCENIDNIEGESLLPEHSFTLNFKFYSPYQETTEKSTFKYLFLRNESRVIETIINYEINGIPQTSYTMIYVTYGGKWSILSNYSASVGEIFTVNIAGNIYQLKVMSANANSVKLEFDDVTLFDLAKQGEWWIDDNEAPFIVEGSYSYYKGFRVLNESEVVIVLNTTTVENNTFKGYFYFLSNIHPTFQTTETPPPTTMPPTTAPPTTAPPTTLPPTTVPPTTMPPQTGIPSTPVPGMTWSQWINNMINRTTNLEEGTSGKGITEERVREIIKEEIANIPWYSEAQDAKDSSTEALAKVDMIMLMMYAVIALALASVYFSVKANYKKQSTIEEIQESSDVDDARTDIKKRIAERTARELAREEERRKEKDWEKGGGEKRERREP